MDVGIVEAGHDGGAVGVDDLGLATAQAEDVAIAAHAHNLIAAHGNGFRHGASGIRRIDSAVVDDEIDRTVTVVALGTDDEAGDERGGDDPDDNECSEADRHLVAPNVAAGDRQLK